MAVGQGILKAALPRERADKRYRTSDKKAFWRHRNRAKHPAGSGGLLLKEQNALKAYRLEELRREIAVGIEQANRGD